MDDTKATNRKGETMARNNYYILDADGNAEPTEALTMGKWFAEDQVGRRRVALDKIGKLQVSTVFLGINHQWGDGPPVLWETMAFGLPANAEEIQLRYSSKADALAGHKRTCDEMRAATRWYRRWFGRLFFSYQF